MRAELWNGCYDAGWNGLIVPDAFAHPAKFSYRLVQRIVSYGLEKGYWKPGDVIGDPFGGVALGGIVCGYAGLNWIGVELEPRFVELGNRNLALHGPKWMILNQTNCVKLVQGDSRRFAEIVRGAGGVVTSPPYSGMAPEKGSGGVDIQKQWNTYRNSGGGQTLGQFIATQEKHSRGYGEAEGQIGRLREGDLDAAITSPPYVSGGHHADQTGAWGGQAQANDKDVAGYGSQLGQIGKLKEGDLSGIVTSPPYAETRFDGGEESLKKPQGFSRGYSKEGGYAGNADGQIGRLKEGEIEGVVTSPPWEDQEPSHAQNDTPSKRRMNAHALSGRTVLNSEYGKADGQIGTSSGETYWSAMKQVYASMRDAMKPGAVAAVVLKSCVKKGKIVDLPSQTVQLLEHLGFKVFLRVRAMLTKTETHEGLFGKVTKKKERKSFFRRLAESKGSPAIDFEEVLWARKPAK